MTQLYRLDCSAARIAERFGALPGKDPWDGGYVAPLRFAPVVTAGRDFIAGPSPQSRRPAERAMRPRIVPRLWGVLPPPNAHDPARRITNVRNPDSPFWIGNLRNSEFRCAIPATAIMLWGSETDYEGRRLKHWFAPVGETPFALAGVWKDEEVPAFALITSEAQGAPKAAGATSMPLLLPAEARARHTWLHGDWNAARALIEKPSSEDLIAVEEP